MNSANIARHGGCGRFTQSAVLLNIVINKAKELACCVCVCLWHDLSRNIHSLSQTTAIQIVALLLMPVTVLLVQ